MAKSLLIAGYYRSGTSALAGALHRAGVDVFNSDERNTHNPRGYYENPAMIALDLEVFDRLERPWHDIRLMPSQWRERPDVKAVGHRMTEQLQGAHGESALWATKHPHICRLLPLYRDAAHQVTGQLPGVIRMFRDPWGVADSQRKKNGLSRAHALLLWASHVLEAEQDSRDLERSLVSYELLMRDPADVLRNIEADTGVEMPARSARDIKNISQFVTPSLRRSSTSGRSQTPEILRSLIEDIWDASLDDATPDVFARHQSRFIECCQFIDELASSELAPTHSLKPSTQPNTRQREQTPTIGADLRPAERVDSAEKARLLARLDEQERVPSCAVIVAVPAGRVEQAYSSAESIENQWLEPESVQFVCADTHCPEQSGWIHCDAEPAAITARIADLAARADADYVAVIDAGDTIEPDATARMALSAAVEQQPALLYSDEIVANPRKAWLRRKPDFDIYRLRGLAYLTSWLWMKTESLRQIGGLNSALVGAEEHDLALRVHDAGQAIVRVPEAIYARYPDTHRDQVEADTLHANCHAALVAHLERNALGSHVVAEPGQIPGQFTLSYSPTYEGTLTLVLMCDNANPADVQEMAPETLGSLLEGGAIERVICAGTTNSDAIAEALEALAARVDGTDIQVVLADTEAQLLSDVSKRASGLTSIFLSLDSESHHPNWIAHLQGRLEHESVGIVALAGDYPGQDKSRRLIGPLLYPANGGITAIGLGRASDDPGPGAWLMSPQAVDGVIPPCVAVRNEVLKGITIHKDYAGAALWLDISRQCERVLGYDVLWDPSVRMHCGKIPSQLASLNEIDGEQRARLDWQWSDQSSTHHHPHLALAGDTLSPVTQPGLQRPAPALEPAILASGTPENAGFITECLKAARANGDYVTGWAYEPFPIAELQRVAPSHWLRVNPEQPIDGPVAPDYSVIYTQPPSADADYRGIGDQATSTIATSPILAEAIRKRSHGQMAPAVVQPRLPQRIWDGQPPRERTNTNKMRVMWVDEGEPPAWIAELLSINEIDWYVVENAKRQYNGPIATAKIPETEQGWHALFQDVAPHIVIRPAKDETWMDCRLLLRGAAAGAMLLTDDRFDRPTGLPVTTVDAKYDAWRKVLRRLVEDPETVSDAGRHAHESLARIGWIENDAACLELVDPGQSDQPAQRSA